MERPRPRLLFISGEPFGARMSGPAIRAYQLGRALAGVADVTLAGRAPSEPPAPGVEHVSYEPHDPRALRAPIMAADAIVAQPQWPLATGWMRESGARLIFDLFVPEQLEALERYRGRSLRGRLLQAFILDRLRDAFRAGHHFLCASERQRDMWIGAIREEGLLTPAVTGRDGSLRSVIDVVAYGTPPEPPARSGRGGVRAHFPQIADEDEIVLWPSAIWPWFDAETAIRAMTMLGERRPRARLVFLGRGEGLAAIAADTARATARELGLLDRSVFFNDGWVPYEERVDWLMDAAAAVSTHFATLETRFSFRTRLLDCIWAGLPVVATGGDDLSAEIEAAGGGVAVPERDPAAVADGLAQVLERGRDAFAPALAELAERYAWKNTSQALARFVTAPELPPRLGDDAAARRPAGHVARSAAYRTGRALLAAVGKAGAFSRPD
jgi:glycosyltransferase involved in cell wall biosynthesis